MPGMRKSERSKASGQALAVAGAALLMVAGAAHGARGAAPRWTAVGPGGGPVYGLVAAPSEASVLYGLGAGPSFFRSADGGGSWQLRSSGTPLPRFTVQTPAVDPADASHVVAASLDPSTADFPPVGVYESFDGGATWRPASDGLGTDARHVQQLVFDPRDPTALYAATNAGIYVRRLQQPWSLVGLGSSQVFSLAFNPAAHRTLLAAAGPGPTGGIFKSVDGGATWVRKAAIFPPRQISYDPLDTRRVFATDGGGLFRSVDGGETWVRRSIPTSAFAFVLGEEAGTVYLATIGGVYRSADEGDHWSGFGNRPQDSLFAILRAPGTGEILLTAGDRGLWRSTDGAQSWTPASLGIAIHTPVALTVLSDAAGTVYFSDLGVFRSGDHGASWKSVNQGLAASSGVNPPPLPTPLLAASAASPAVLYAGSPAGIVHSVDGGGHWRAALEPTPLGTALNDVVADPTTPRTAYAISYPTLGHEDDCHALKTTDGGDHWQCLPVAALQLVVHPKHPQQLAAIDGSVLRSFDGGASWRALASFDENQLRSLAFDPLNPSVLYVGTFDGVYVSRDGGVSLAKLGTGLPSAAHVESILVDPANSAVLYAGVVHPLAGGDLEGVGAFRSTDRGAHWLPLAVGLPPEFDGHLALDARNHLLYAATAAHGLYRLALGGR